MRARNNTRKAQRGDDDEIATSPTLPLKKGSRSPSRDHGQDGFDFVSPALVVGAAFIFLLFGGIALFVRTDLTAKGASPETQLKRKLDKAGVLSQLKPADYTHYTIRINTWKREEQLQLSIEHHLTCEAAAQIQIVWCIDQGPVPSWLRDLEEKEASTYSADDGSIFPRVVVEAHKANSLNERFSILTEPSPTAAILSIDDDVLRPCLALDTAFAKWTMNPDRQVGFDARSHEIDQDGDFVRWKYAYMSTTEKTNAYSTTLTRFSFLHADYMRSYMSNPALEPMRTTVAKNFNCEDIAMSLYVSSLTDGLPPLLADLWAVKSQIKMYSENKISGGKSHKGLRDACVNDFSDLLNLKPRLQRAELRHADMFDYGIKATNWNIESYPIVEEALHESLSTIERWKIEGNIALFKELTDMSAIICKQAFEQGLIEKTAPWKERFHHDHK